MSPLRPKLLFNPLSKAIPATRECSTSHEISGNSKLLKAACMLAAAGSLFSIATPAQAGTFTWGTGAGEQNWPNPPSTDNEAPQTYTVNGVNITITPSEQDLLPAPPPPAPEPGFGDVVGVPTPGLSAGVVTGNIPGDNLLVGFESGSVATNTSLQIEFTNAAGNRVPVAGLDFTIIDIDRDVDNQFWQDVVTVGASTGGPTGTFVLPGTQLIQNNAVVEVAPPAGRAYTLPAGFTDANTVSFRGQASAPNTGTDADFGNVNLVYPSPVDTFRIIYGNGPADAASNGGAQLYAGSGGIPRSHAVGLLSSFEFFPGIIGVAESAGTPVPITTGADAGSFRIPYTVRVRNLGETDLANVQLANDLQTTFANATGFRLENLQSTGLTVNPALNGQTQATLTGSQDLLLGTDALPIGEEREITFDIVVSPGASATDDRLYDNQTIATGNIIDRNGVTTTAETTDRSNDFVTGTAPNTLTVFDENSDGDPTAPTSGTVRGGDTGDDTQTTVQLSQPGIALSKRVTAVAPVDTNGDGVPDAFDVTYRQLVQNIGSVPLSNVQITENLNDTFRIGGANPATSFNVQSITAVTSAADIGPGVNAADFVPLVAGAPANLQNPAVGQMLAPGNPGNTLAPDQFGAVDFVVRVQPGAGTEGHGGNNAPFASQATAIGTPPAGTGITSVTDPSDDGVQFPRGTAGAPAGSTLDGNLNGNGNEGAATVNPPDADGNTGTVAEPAGQENNPTPVRFPKIAVAKQISSVTGEGTPANPFVVTYDVVVQNVGGIRLNNVQVTEENIDAVFDDLPPGNTTVVGLVTSPNSTATPNGNFDGETDLNLIQPNTLTLEPEQSANLQYQVQVINPTVTPTPRDYESSSTGSGEGIPGDANGTVAGNPLVASPPGTGGASSALVTDLSDDGSVTDPVPNDGDRGGGPGENDPTVVSFGAQIGLTKQVTSVVPDPADPNSFLVTFDYRVENVGAVPLNGVDIFDNYDDQFNIGQPSGVTSYVVQSVTPGAPVAPGAPVLGEDPTAETSTQGSGELRLTNGGPATTFNPGDAATTQVVVRVTGPVPGSTYSANARTQGTSAANPGTVVSDISDDIPLIPGTDPNPGILRPAAPGEDPLVADRPTVVDLASRLVLFKTITSTSRTGPITTPAAITGAPPSVIGSTDITAFDLQPGDTVEYSIYALNLGAQAITNLEICDPLARELVLAPNPFIELPVGATAQAIDTLSIPSLAPAGLSCTPIPPNSTDTAVFSLGTLSSADGVRVIRFNAVVR